MCHPQSLRTPPRIQPCLRRIDHAPPAERDTPLHLKKHASSSRRDTPLHLNKRASAQRNTAPPVEKRALATCLLLLTRHASPLEETRPLQKNKKGRYIVELWHDSPPICCNISGDTTRRNHQKWLYNYRMQKKCAALYKEKCQGENIPS